MYLVYVYDDRKHLVDKFTEGTYKEAINRLIASGVTVVEGNSYEIMRVSNV